MTAWAHLDGWQPDPRRPGFLRDPERPGWLRTPDGRWWSQADYDSAAAEVDNTFPESVLRRIAEVEELRRRLQGIGGRRG